MKEKMELAEGMPVRFGPEIQGTIFGGPYRNYVPGQRRLVGIKMAKEITDRTFDFKVDTEDFSVPPVKDMQDGLVFGLKALIKGHDLYVGCMGGTGRTGLYMGCMAKCMLDDMARTDGRLARFVMHDPVTYVRNHYRKHAIETEEQMAYVRGFDSAPVLDAVTEHYRRKVDRQVVYRDVVRTVTEYVDRVQYLGPLDWVIHKLFK